MVDVVRSQFTICEALQIVNWSAGKNDENGSRATVRGRQRLPQRSPITPWPPLRHLETAPICILRDSAVSL